ncbi:MAG TPA: hypothetical protein DEG71_06875, partial [Clostridiales bacterium]|nr:hypothetical protein [Clostridiales bacterium]
LTSNVSVNGAGTGSFINDLSSLLPNLTYYVRAYATNTDGTAYGSQVTFCCIRDWTGASSRNWNTTSNWIKNTVPTRYTNVYINSVVNDPLIVGAMQCNNLTILPGASLAINAGQSLYVYGTLTIDGDLVLKSDMSGVASIIVAGAIGGANVNNVIVEKYVSGTSKKSSNLGVFHYVSPPVSGAVTDSFPDRAYIYDETNPNNLNDISAGWQYINNGASVVLLPGRGYSINNVNPQTIQFVGSLNTGNINVPVTNSAKGLLTDGWNIIGNPYPSSVNATLFITDAANSIITGTLYYWDDDISGGTGYKTNDYATWNGAGSVGGNGHTPNAYIPSGQGFIVKANVSGNLIFRNTMKVVNAGVPIKSNEEELYVERVYLEMTSSDNRKNELLIAMLDDATENFDRLYDSYKLQGNENISFYSLLNNEKLSIQSLPSNQNAYSINLGYDIKLSGSFEIKLKSTDNINNAKYIYLEDKITNTFTNLNNSIYSFNADGGTSKDRFILHITDWALSNNCLSDINTNKIKVLNDGKFIEITNLDKDSKIAIYDMQGRCVKSSTSDKSSFKYNFQNEGVYLINISNNDYNISRKVILQNK